MMNDNMKAEANREPLSYSLIKMAQELRDYSETIYGRVQGRLEKVQLPSAPISDRSNKEMTEEAWPPLYDEIRMHLKEVRKQLTWIGESINRAEL